jgi:Lrp/AsnC family transcriptional regulator for asnA, asnC and gidA
VSVSDISFLEEVATLATTRGKRVAAMIIDETDAAIIELLQEDGRMSAVEIAGHLEGVTPRVVRHRIKKLVRDGVISVTAVVHPKALGYDIMADVLIEAELPAIRSIARRLAELEHVTYASCATGESDISIQVVARSVEELHSVVLDRIHNMPGITRTRTFILPLALKFTYNWKVPGEAHLEAGTSSQNEGGETLR